MTNRIVIGVLAALILAAVVVGISNNAYQAGFARGLANREAVERGEQPGQIAPRPEGMPPYGYYGPYWHRPWGFGFFGFLFPLLFFFLIFAMIRGAFWRPWGWSGRAAFEEWHRQAHESQPGGQKM